MKTILTHYVQIEKYEVPDSIAKLDNDEIQNYIVTKSLKPVDTDSRDWEVVDVSDD